MRIIKTDGDTLLTTLNQASAIVFRFNACSPVADLTNPFIYGGGANALIGSATSLKRIIMFEYYNPVEHQSCIIPKIKTCDNFKFNGKLAGRYDVFEMSDCPPDIIIVLNMNFLTAIKVIII